MIHVHTAHPEYVEEEGELPDAQRLHQIRQARLRLAQKRKRKAKQQRKRARQVEACEANTAAVAANVAILAPALIVDVTADMDAE